MRLLLLAASGLLPLVIVLAWGIDHLFQERRGAAERSALDLSRALATAIDSELRSVQSLLEQMGTSDELERADLRAFHLSSRRNADQLGWRQVTLADGEGHVLFRSNQPFDNFNAQAVDAESLAEVIAERKPLVSNVVVAPTDGSRTFAVRVPVMRGGQIVYVLTAVLSADVVANTLTRQGVPTDAVASVFDRSGYRLARTRPPVDAQPTPSLKRLLASREEQGTGVTVTSEGEEVYTGFTRLLDSGWTVVVGTSVLATTRSFSTLLSVIAGGLAASLGLSLLLAWLLSRRVIDPIEQLKEGAAALGRGAPVDIPRLDIMELDDVAQALNSAARERDMAHRLIQEALHTAEEANRSKDQFLAMLGHELRNPLAPIANAVQLMAMKGDDGTAQERRIIERQLVHVTRLVDDLLDVSRITSGRLTLRRVPVRIAHVLEQVVDAIQPSLLHRALSLHIDDSAQQAWVEGDEVRLAQVFNNLLVNAIKFTPPGGAIHMRARRTESEVLVEVEDSGVGIEPDELKRVFDLFYQAPQSTDRARGGLGLGLSIVKSLVQMHGGRVNATSAGTGRGTCVTVRLPLCDPPAETRTPAATQPPAEKGAGRVLVVDDNEDAADTCATLLEMSGYEVRVAYTPEAAIETMESFHPDVAILDIGLPGMNGYELGRALKRGGYTGKLAALTGYGQATDMATSKAAGFDAHLTKPVSPQELLELVAKFAAGSDASLRA
jgi:signal transduction histidine kinase/ActR/RegA family two-component response regulator